ncbi:putative transmembrane protein [Toxoplasma gondii TgCatPRC2]|uniref:Putative transmembrane protein n=1 Tax=Toxoplasma gondii TgCatPRC2 TaxID=1130821 RepID=A0A151HDT6_TOXGO|nr:putative transmembrane protein [Toxoplasma gondii TgCatPRC2]
MNRFLYCCFASFSMETAVLRPPGLGSLPVRELVQSRRTFRPARSVFLIVATLVLYTFTWDPSHDFPITFSSAELKSSSEEPSQQPASAAGGTDRFGSETSEEGKNGSLRKEKKKRDSPPVRCAQSLRDAVNGAISEISGTRVLVEHLLRLWSSVPYVPMLVCPSSIFPYAPTLPWPKQEDLRDGDLLKDVLSTGTLTVAGVGAAAVAQSSLTVVAARNRGEEGDYNRPEPTGFFPQYLRLIAAIIGAHYDTPISVHWLFYPSVEEAQRAVLNGQAHMTDIYFLLGQSTPGEPQPLMDFYATCPVVGSPALLILRDDSHEDARQSTTTKKPGGSRPVKTSKNELINLNRRIENAEENWERTVVFLSQDLANTVQHSLSPKALLHFTKTLEAAAKMVNDWEAAAVMTTGVIPTLPPSLKVVDAHLLLAKGAWIERTHALECMEAEHDSMLTEYAEKKVSDGSGALAFTRSSVTSVSAFSWLAVAAVVLSSAFTY